MKQLDSLTIETYTLLMIKEIASALLVPVLFISCASEEKESEHAKIFSATDNFTIDLNSGTYIDKVRNAIAIDAANPEFRAKMIPSYINIDKIDGISSEQTYTAYLTVLSEIDGESKYQLSVNGTVIGYGFAPATENDFSETQLNMGTLSLKTGDRIEVASSAVTIGKIPENGETAYSRGRWTALRLDPVH